MFSCLSPKQKFDRLVKKHPEFVQSKTIVDTLIIPGAIDSVMTKLVFRNLKIALEDGRAIKIEDGKMVPDSFILKKPGILVKVLIDTLSIEIKVEYEKKQIVPQVIKTNGKKISAKAEITDSTIKLSAKVERDTIIQLLECPEYKSCNESAHKEIKVTYFLIGAFSAIGLILLILWLIRKLVK